MLLLIPEKNTAPLGRLGAGWVHAEGIRASLRGCGFCSQAVASPGSHQTRVTNAALLCHQCKPQSDSAKRFQAEEGSQGKGSAPVRWRREFGFLLRGRMTTMSLQILKQQEERLWVDIEKNKHLRQQTPMTNVIRRQCAQVPKHHTGLQKLSIKSCLK